MKLKALVVDDSRVMRTMVMRMLGEAKLAEFEFIEAEDGVDALHKFSPESVDIAFVDWNMPNMSGIDFVRKVRANRNARHVPIVMVTSERTMGKMEDALDRAGASAYICKPFTAAELQAKLSKIITSMPEKKGKSGGFFGKMLGD
ncbi:MAG: response regulator [Chloroflexi bacterium]|nr:response regulator [Chloroflexota bacterium]